MFVRNRIVISFILLLPITLFGQVESSYLPLSNTPRNLDSLIRVIDRVLDKDLTKVDDPYKKKMEEAYIQRAAHVRFSVEEGHFLFDDFTEAYLNNVLAEILKSNPEIPKKRIRVFLGAYPWPNATCLGEGSIVVNVGLLRRLENESQLAFVLCHEIAHYTLHHSNESIRRNVDLHNNKNIKKAVKDISRIEYGSGRIGREFMMRLVYNNRKHSRDREKEADQLGLQYLKKTKYNIAAVEELLNILDVIDEEKYDPNSVAEVFNPSEYPFKPKWIVEEQLLGFGGEEDYRISDDSLKTHPDCKERIRLLDLKIDSAQAKATKDLQEIPYSEIAYLSDFEMVEGYLFFEDYGRCMYNAIKLLKQHPEDAFIYATIGKCFHLIYLNRLDHSLGHKLQHPKKGQKEAYQEVLRFLRKLRIKEMAKLNYHFLKEQKDKFIENEDFLFAWIMANDMMKFSKETNALKRQYLKKYRNKGYYTDYIREHETTEE